MLPRFVRSLAAVLAVALLPATPVGAFSAMLPDGRSVTPVGFTIPVEGFASDLATSPDGRWLAILSQDGGALDIVGRGEKPRLVDRLALPSATALCWTADGLYVARGYTGVVARFAYDGSSPSLPRFTPRPDLTVVGPGLLDGVAEDPATHRIAVSRTADREVVVFDDRSGAILARHKTSGQPFDVAFAGGALVATLYDSDRVALWHDDSTASEITTGPHPTRLLVARDRVFVANADGHDVVALDPAAGRIVRRYDLGIGSNPPPGQTPSGMAISDDGSTLFVTESGFNDVAVVDLASGAALARIPTGWYPMAVATVDAATVGKKDPRPKRQLFVLSAKGFGSQPDPGGEWNGTYTGFLQHLVVSPTSYAAWTAQVRRDDRFATAPSTYAHVPPIEHVVFIVRENKHFDEEFGDEPNANADPSLLVFGRTYTPNAHAIAERYTLFDNFMSNGEASIYGHAWTVQGMANDYHERNAHARDEGLSGVDARVPFSIWPIGESGEDSVPPGVADFDWFKNLADLPQGPRVNVSGVFGPRGELIDELQRRHISYRVYGEQMTMEPDGDIAPGLATHADREYPGAHIDFNVSDTARAAMFLRDVAAHGLPQYAYVTLPTDHTAGRKAGFMTPQSYIADNDLAFGRIVAGLSKRPDWKNTVVFETYDDAQGTGDHVDAHRMAAIAAGPYVKRGFVDHTRYSIPSILRTVEVLYRLEPLNVYDAAATPMLDAFTARPQAEPFTTVAENVPMERNPGTATSLLFPIDGPDDARVAEDDWESVRGPRALASVYPFDVPALEPATTIPTAGDD
jgi:YVTN family beta-propeller protein